MTPEERRCWVFFPLSQRLFRAVRSAHTLSRLILTLALGFTRPGVLPRPVSPGWQSVGFIRRGSRQPFLESGFRVKARCSIPGLDGGSRPS